MPWVLDEDNSKPVSTGGKWILDDPVDQVKENADRSLMQQAGDFASAVGHNLMRPLHGGAQLIENALASGANAIAPDSSVAKYLQQNASQTNADIKKWEEEYQKETPDSAASYIGAGVGQIAPFLVSGPAQLLEKIGSVGAKAVPFAPKIASAATQGGVLAAAQPVVVDENKLSDLVLGTAKPQESFGEKKAEQIGLGALFGGLSPLAGKAISRIVNPQTDEAALQLMKEGVRLTPGQVLGGAAKRAEEGATSIPITGDAIRASLSRGVEDFNRATVNRALAPIGKKFGKDVSPGNEMIDNAHKLVSENYNKLLPKLNPLTADKTFNNEISNLSQLAQNMHPDSAQQFNNIIQNELLRKFTNAGTMSSTSMKEVESQLGNLARKFGKTPDANSQLLGDALQEAQRVIRSAVERQNPNNIGELKKANLAWAELLRIENAAGRQGANEGIFTPAQYKAAVRALDPSLRKSQFARGNALAQDWANAATKVLGNKVPDSGTPYRSLLAAGTLGAGAINPALPAAAIGGAALYQSPVQKALVDLMTKRPDLAPQIAQHLERISQSGGILSPMFVNSTGE